MRIGQLVPWFIAGFLLMIGARSADCIPTVLLEPISQASVWLTFISMAALGLSVDVHAVAQARPHVTAAVVLSLLLLGALASALIWMLDPTR